jgi:hypothetical protein
MNKAQKILTVIGCVVLVVLGYNYTDSSHSNIVGGLVRYSGPNASDAGVFIVGAIVTGVIYTALFFMLKDKAK